VSNLQFSPPCSPPCSPNGAEVTVGERVVALATIQNQGTVAVGPFAVQFGVTDASGTVVGSQRISWPGLAAMAEAQVSYAFDTVAIGSFTASVVLDADDVIAETAESDNLAQGTFQVNAPSLLTSELVLERSGTSILGVVTDTASDLLYSIWSDGDIYRTDTDAMSELVFSGNGTASAFAVSTSGLPEGVLAVDGIIHRVNLPTGSVSSVSEELWAIPRKLALAGDGSVFAVMDNSVVAFTQGLAFLAEASLSGSVTAAAYDDAREVLYVLTSNGLFAFNDGLDPLCSVTMFAGTPTALELGATGLYVGTSAGYVYAMSYCMSHGGSPPLIVDSWRYPASGELGGSVTAITNDPRGFDPVYVAASSVVSLTYGGTLLWTYPADGASLAGTISEIAVEERTGRLFFVDAAGAPRLVETNGADVSFGVATGGSPAGFAVVALDEYRAETRAGSQLIRAYYYGMGDSVFRIESDR